MESTGHTDDDEPVDGFLLLRRRRDGTYRRLGGTEVSPAGTDPVTGVNSKDVTVDQVNGVTARLYLPPTAGVKLPILVYFHGGGFYTESAASPKYHCHVNAVSLRANVVVVSVNYRLAPENPLPAAYEDAWTALRWTAAAADPWIEAHGDVTRLFIMGDSAGGNIAHNVSMQATSEGIALEGLITVHPFFYFTSKDMGMDPAIVEKVWRSLYPTAAHGLAEPCIRPSTALLGGLRCSRVLVCTAEEDLMKHGGRIYYEEIKKSGFGGKVEFLESKGKGHVFYLDKPDCSGAEEIMKIIVGFIQ